SEGQKWPKRGLAHFDHCGCNYSFDWHCAYNRNPSGNNLAAGILDKTIKGKHKAAGYWVSKGENAG
ncbi:MAG: hypothetical protein AB1589_45410, partial [Cyanobacteriota bacterium]